MHRAWAEAFCRCETGACDRCETGACKVGVKRVVDRGGAKTHRNVGSAADAVKRGVGRGVKWV